MSSHTTSRIVARLSIGAALIATLVTHTGCSDDGDRGVTFSVGPTPTSFAAVQDGNGPWLVVKAASDGTYSFIPTAATYGIAVVCQAGASAMVTIVQTTVAETRSQRIGCDVASDATGTISGTVAGADPAMAVHVANQSVGRPPGPYMVTAAPAGQWDVFAFRGARQAFPFVPDRIIRKDAVTVSPNSTTMLDFDFATEGFAPESHAVTIEGVLPTEDARVRTTLRNMPGGTSLTFASSVEGRFHALPTSHLRGDDIHFIDVTAPVGGTTDSAYRGVRRWAVATSDFTASLPPMPAPPLVSSDDTEPYLRMRGTLPPGVDADRYDFLYSQTRSSSYTAWITTLSRGYVDASTNEYTLPDLTALAGFSAAWGLMIATPVQWAFTTTASEAGVADLLTTGLPADELDERVEAITYQTGRFPR